MISEVSIHSLTGPNSTLEQKSIIGKADHLILTCKQRVIWLRPGSQFPPQEGIPTQLCPPTKFHLCDNQLPPTSTIGQALSIIISFYWVLSPMNKEYILPNNYMGG